MIEYFFNNWYCAILIQFDMKFFIYLINYLFEFKWITQLNLKIICKICKIISNNNYACFLVIAEENTMAQV